MQYKCPICGGGEKRCALGNNSFAECDWEDDEGNINEETRRDILDSLSGEVNWSRDSCESRVCFQMGDKICYGSYDPDERCVFYNEKEIYPLTALEYFEHWGWESVKHTTPYFICSSCFRNEKNKKKIALLFPFIKINWKEIYCVIDWFELQKDREESFLPPDIQTKIKIFRGRKDTSPTICEEEGEEEGEEDYEGYEYPGEKYLKDARAVKLNSIAGSETRDDYIQSNIYEKFFEFYDSKMKTKRRPKKEERKKNACGKGAVGKGKNGETKPQQENKKSKSPKPVKPKEKQATSMMVVSHPALQKLWNEETGFVFEKVDGIYVVVDKIVDNKIEKLNAEDCKTCRKLYLLLAKKYRGKHERKEKDS